MRCRNGHALPCKDKPPGKPRSARQSLCWRCYKASHHRRSNNNPRFPPSTETWLELPAGLARCDRSWIRRAAKQTVATSKAPAGSTAQTARRKSTKAERTTHAGHGIHPAIENGTDLEIDWAAIRGPKCPDCETIDQRARHRNTSSGWSSPPPM